MFEPRKIDTFTAIITKEIVNNKKVLKQYELISKLGHIQMYAVIKKGVSFENFKHLPWKLVIRFNEESEINGILQFIYTDARGVCYT